MGAFVLEAAASGHPHAVASVTAAARVFHNVIVRGITTAAVGARVVRETGRDTDRLALPSAAGTVRWRARLPRMAAKAPGKEIKGNSMERMYIHTFINMHKHIDHHLWEGNVDCIFF